MAFKPISRQIIIVIMGICGAGKSTLGKALAQQLNCLFLEGDDFHSPENKCKMKNNIPLNDKDRQPWLKALSMAIDDEVQKTDKVVVACSALKKQYREWLRFPGKTTIFVFLQIPHEEAVRRVKERKDHFMDPNLVSTQLADLEPPPEALSLSAINLLELNIENVLSHLANKTNDTRPDH